MENKPYNNKIKNLLGEVQEQMLSIFGHDLKKVILFGSYARNEADDESDIDILLLIDEEPGELKRYHDQIIDVMVDLSIKYDIVLSIIEQEYKQFNKYAKFVPFYENVQNDGIELYAR